MPSPGSVCRAALLCQLLAAPSHAATGPYFAVVGGDSGPWAAIFGSIGLEQRAPAAAGVVVVRPGTPGGQEWIDRVERGAILVLEGESPVAEAFGFRKPADGGTVAVTSLKDSAAPDLAIVWEKRADVPVFDLPPGVEVFARDRPSGTPVCAGIRRGRGAVLWLAVFPGERGYERFPYLLDALYGLGLEPPFRSARLWAFFDSSYRLRVDIDYFAARWRKAGISALHVAAWHYYEPDPERDRYLSALIAACHRQGILVYAWLDLPHVSDTFWNDHPQWREKTALLQDAQLDWRKLMNLTNRDCFHAVSEGISGLTSRFDWDGINLAELYFESLQGIANPSRFTPMNDDVRALFRRQGGFDPIELFGSRRDDRSRRLFLDFRSGLAARMQEEWIGEMESLRRAKPYLDVVLTHVDDRVDPSMREAIGADAARLLTLLDKHAVTLLIEDPATVWHLGPQRYHLMAENYRSLSAPHEKLAIDLNIVTRYQDVYPTRQQTGTELLQLVHSAASNFERVALYFENSLATPDLRLLPAAVAGAAAIETLDSKVVVTSAIGVGIAWKGAARVDGVEWPAVDGQTVWLPPGRHTVEPGAAEGAHLLHLSARLKTAAPLRAGALEFSYSSTARAIAILDRVPNHLRVDGTGAPIDRPGSTSLILPPGDHLVTITFD